MRKKKLKCKIKHKKKDGVRFIKFTEIKVKTRSELNESWPLIGIDNVVVYHGEIEITTKGKTWKSESISCYDSIMQKNYSLNGICKTFTGWPFPYETGIVKTDSDGNYMDIEVLK